MELNDKDIDLLFSNRLQDLEAEPSAGTWDKIAAGLNQSASRKGLMPYLRIAASVLILLGAGTWLLLKQTETAVKRGKRTQITARVSRKPVNTQQIDTHIPITVRQEQPVIIAAVKGSPVKHQSHNIVQHNSNDDVVQQQAEQTQLASLTVPAHTLIKQPVVPDEIIAAQPVEDKPIFKSITALPIVQTLASAPAAKTKAKKHGIHSLGDVVNLVVAKVDKRSDKLIEFTDTDDDEAVITGINLGLFSIKKEQ